MVDDHLVCENCLAKNELKDEIVKRGTLIPKCSICQSKNVKALSTNDEQFKRILRALVRLNYSELQYNQHMGGDSLQSLVFGDKHIFDLKDGVSPIDFEEAYLPSEEDWGWYPENPDHITLGGGYWDGGVLKSVNKSIDYEVLTIVHRSLNSNYHLLEKSINNHIEKIREHITVELVEGEEFWRARIGVNTRLKSTESFVKPENRVKYIPHTNTDISSPPPSKAGEGRLNRFRVAILYMASDENTAIAELRPHPGQLISLGKFKSKKPIKYANLANHDIRDYLSDELLDKLNHILSISKVLNMPVQPDNIALYMATQLFSDGLRNAGFEAVSFKSSLGNGINFASFYPEQFEYVPASGIVHKINSLNYQSSQLGTLSDGESKENYKEANDLISTLFDQFE